MDEKPETLDENTMDPQSEIAPQGSPESAAPETPHATPTPQATSGHLPPMAAIPQNPYSKTPGLAAFLSIVPGLGNIYNGLYLRGVAFFLTYVSLFSLAAQTADHRGNESDLAFLIPSLIFFWFFNIFDAYRQALLINYHNTYQELPSKVEKPPVGGGLVAGIIVFLVGLYGTLRKYFDIDMAWLLDLWPFVLMILGAYLVWDQLRKKPSKSEDSI